MQGVWDYIGQSFLNKKFRFKCECLMRMDFVGLVVDYEKNQDEMVLVVSNNCKIIRLGLNHPNLTIEEV